MRKARNLGHVHGIRHDQRAGALGKIKVRDDLKMVGQGLIDGVVPCGYVIRVVGRAIIYVIDKISVVDPYYNQRVSGIRWRGEAVDLRHQVGAVMAVVGPVLVGVIGQSLLLRQHLNPNPAVGIAFAVVICVAGSVCRGGKGVAKNIEVRKGGLGRTNGKSDQQYTQRESKGFFHVAILPHAGRK